MADKQKARRVETELGQLVVSNIARIMEREQEKHGMGKVAFARFCQITAPSYLSILDGAANPTLYMMTRIARSLGIPLQELMSGERRGEI